MYVSWTQTLKFSFRNRAGGMTSQQDSLSGVIICPTLSIWKDSG